MEACATADIIDIAKYRRERCFDAPRLADGRVGRVPAELFELLKLTVDMLAAREAVTIVATRKQLTTQETADFLGMSRPTFAKLADAGRIPCTKVGRHRRIRVAELLTDQDELAAQP